MWISSLMCVNKNWWDNVYIEGSLDLAIGVLALIASESAL